jgi:vacuolar protein sorting-associated protein 13A/C
LTSDASDSLHLLERININLQVQNSIVPGALNLARIKVSGKLPTLQVNLSDTKYKALMRLIDVCIPKFDNESEVDISPPLQMGLAPGGFRLPSGLFGKTGMEYNIDEEEGDDDDGSSTREEQFFEAEDGNIEV